MSTFSWHSFECSESDFKGKSFLITGAASGIGRSLTLKLSLLGATVLMLDKKSRHLEKLYDEIVARGNEQPIILPVDLENINPESATQLAQGILDELQYIDGLVHCAAELGSPSPMDQYDMKYWDMVMQVNLRAPYILTRSLLPLMKSKTHASILYSSADVGRSPQAYWGAFSIAYAGLEAQMKLWAEELENTSSIKVNSIDPGPVRTTLRRRSHPGESQDALRTPDEIINAYLYLLSNKHNHHGEALAVQS